MYPLMMSLCLSSSNINCFHIDFVVNESVSSFSSTGSQINSWWFGQEEAEENPLRLVNCSLSPSSGDKQSQLLEGLVS